LRQPSEGGEAWPGPVRQVIPVATGVVGQNEVAHASPYNLRTARLRMLVELQTGKTAMAFWGIVIGCSCA